MGYKGERSAVYDFLKTYQSFNNIKMNTLHVTVSDYKQPKVSGARLLVSGSTVRARAGTLKFKALRNTP